MEKLGLNKRQIQAVDYAVEKGVISNKEYQKLTDISGKIATRDITDLLKKGVLRRVGKGKRDMRYTLLLRQYDAKMTQNEEG